MPSFLRLIASIISSMASSFALCIKPQVLIITTSARPASFTILKPAFAIFASISSASHWFFGHPRDTIPTFIVSAIIFPYLSVFLILRILRSIRHIPHFRHIRHNHRLLCGIMRALYHHTQSLCVQAPQ